MGGASDPGLEALFCLMKEFENFKWKAMDDYDDTFCDVGYGQTAGIDAI